MIEALVKTGFTKEVPDGSVRGLYFRPSTRSFQLRYPFQGRRENEPCGYWPDVSLALARKIAAQKRALIAQGRNPAAERRAAKTQKPAAHDLVEIAAEQFIARHIRATMRPSWAHEAERMVHKADHGPWAGRRLSEIGGPDIHALLDAISDRPAPVLAEKVFKTLRRFYGWAIDRGVVDASPCVNIKRMRAEKSRDRVFDNDELRRVWQASEKLGFPFGGMFQLLILTGARLGEVSGMRWREVDLATKVWFFQKSEAKTAARMLLPFDRNRRSS